MNVLRFEVKEAVTRIELVVDAEGKIYINAADVYGDDAEKAVASLIVKLADAKGVTPAAVLHDVNKRVRRTQLARIILGEVPERKEVPAGELVEVCAH